MPYCLSCGTEVDECDSAYYARNLRCIPCYNIRAEQMAMASCARCGTRVRGEEMRHRSGSALCSFCASEAERLERLPKCAFCSRLIESWEKSTALQEGGAAHEACLKARQKERKAICSSCGKQVSFFRMLPDGTAICLRCGREGRKGGDKRRKPLIDSVMDKICSILG